MFLSASSGGISSSSTCFQGERRSKLVRLLLAASTLLYLTIFVENIPFVPQTKTAAAAGLRSLSTAAAAAAAATTTTPDLFLHEGELPGDTGWLKPNVTTVHLWQVVAPETTPTSTTSTAFHDTNINPAVVAVNDEWKVQVCCNECDNNSNDDDFNHRPYFYMRAYGPAVYAGTIVKSSSTDDSTIAATTTLCYDASFTPRDVGKYTVELVLTFSSVPPIEAFPLPLHSTSSTTTIEEPKYDGRSIPGFPLQLHVVEETGEQVDDETNNAPLPPTTTNKRLCVTSDLTGTQQSAAAAARWKVVDRVATAAALLFPTFTSATDPAWVEPRSMTGIHMEYEYHSCRLSTLVDELRPRLVTVLQKRKERGLPYARITFIGDSVISLQSRVFNELLLEGVAGIPSPGGHMISFVEWIPTNGGLAKNLKSSIIPAHEKLLAEQKMRAEGDGGQGESNYILFNAGLHDIMQLCPQETAEQRTAYIDESILSSETFSCAKVYETEFRTLVDHIVTATPTAAASTKLRVFQTTNAAWPLYGMMGHQWDAGTTESTKKKDNKQHPFPKTTHMVEAFNDIALRSIDERTDGIPPVFVVDNYQLTLPRPDNRQVISNNDVGSKMVHPGKEVLDAMVRTWATILIESLEADLVVQDVVHL